MVRKERLIQRFMDYVQIDSETRSEGRFAETMKRELEQLGLDVIFDHAGEVVGSDGNNLIARFKGVLPGEPLILSAHMDTVMPGKGIEPVLVDGIIRSRGNTILGSDNKGGVAAILEALECLIEDGVALKPIEVILTIAEEGGLNGAKNLDFSLISGRRGFVLDSGGSPGNIDIMAPGQDKIDARILGKPSHAGMCPEDGINAIQVAARAIDHMRLLRIDEETTANIGIIHGGETTNIVCPEVIIRAEARSLDPQKLEEQTQHMVRCVEEACREFGAESDIHAVRSYDGYSVESDDPWLLFVESVVRKAGLEPRLQRSGGGSDTNIYNGKGFSMLNLGTGMSKVHTTDEFIKVDDLVNLATLVRLLIVEYASMA